MKLSIYFGSDVDPEAFRIAAQAQRKGVKVRLVTAMLAGAVLSNWVGWPLAAAWCAALIVWDAVLVSRIYERVIYPGLSAAPKAAQNTAALLCLCGSSLYCVGWASAWLVGGSSAGLLVGIWFGLTTMHALVFFSAMPRLLLSCILPPTLAIVTLPFVGGMAPAAAISVLLVATLSLLLLIGAAVERYDLIAALAAQSAGRREAEAANTAKSQFLANMSHELRTPLNAVIGYAEILEEDLGADGRAPNAADANRIRKAARHLLGLINEVLDLSKIEAGRMEIALARCEVAQIVADAVEQARPAAEANGNTIDVVMPALDPVIADGGKLGQCLLNFLSNAAKFTTGGRIEVRVALANGVLQLDVEDTGCGIAPGDARRLFQPFTQVDESHTRRAGGTGLGLVITRRLAELMGGDVTFVSAPGEGSTFTLRVAVESAPVEAGPTRPCVLVVEDEASARDLIRRALSSLPYDLRTAGTVAEGLAAFRALDPALVVLDIHLPDGAGWEVLAEVRRTRPGTPVLVVTVDDERGRALALGAADHLVKPADRDQLLAAAVRLTVERRAAA